MMSYDPANIQPMHPEPVAREAVRSKLLELLGLEGVPTTVDHTLEADEDAGDDLRELHVTFRNSLGETAAGIILLPRHAERQSLPGIVCLPGSMASAVTLAYPRLLRHVNRLVGWGRELARRGFATLCLSYKGCNIRRGSYRQWDDEVNALAPYGRNQMGIAVEEALCAALLLAQHEAVDAARIGITGFSLGGQVAWQALACAPWIHMGVPIAGGLGSLATFIREANLSQHGHAFFTPHMLRYFDHPEIVAACIAPRPLMVVAPTMDEDMPRSGVEALKDFVAPVYRSLGHPDHFQVYQPETRHMFLHESFEWVADRFKAVLGAEHQP